MKIGLFLLPLWVPGTPPLGIATLSAVLRREGHHVTVRDLNQETWLKFKNIENSPWLDENLDRAEHPIRFHEEIFPLLKDELNKFISYLLEENFDIVCLSINQINIHISRYIIHSLKKMDPNIKIIIGGPDVYEQNKLLLEDFRNDFINVGIIGEGEESILDGIRILNKEEPLDSNGILTPENVKNKSFRGKRGTIDFSKLPLPDFTDFEILSYKLRHLPVMMSRGCVAACSFCTEFITWRNYRIRTAEHVYEELDHMVKTYGVNDFFFCDSLINGNHVLLEKLVDLINKNKLKITWQAYARADERLTDSLLESMAQSGCRHLNIGFESGSNKILDLMNKSNTAQEGERVAKACLKAGIGIRGLFIIGFPGEGPEDFHKTLSFIWRNAKSFSKVYIGNGLGIPLTAPMGQRPKKFDVRLNEDGSVHRDTEGHWVSRDGSFTIKERNHRLDEARSFLDYIGVDWGPVPEGWNEHKKGLSTKAFEKLKYFFKLKYLKIG